MNRLLQIGFQVVGHWLLLEGEPKLQLDRMQDETNVLYAFVVDGEVKYVGKTTLPLKNRMYGYLKPGPTQSTNIKNRANIKSVLERGRIVQILALSDNGLHHYGDFNINLAAGLEDDLIAKLNPEWNGRLLEGYKSVERNSSQAEEPDVIATAVQSEVQHQMRGVSFSGSESIPENCFILKLHKAYFNSGFFNVGVRYQKLFGDDLEEIRISCEDLPHEFTGYINRTANNNRTPRIMGGAPLKRWFHKVSHLDGLVLVEVTSPTSIRFKKYA